MLTHQGTQILRTARLTLEGTLRAYHKAHDGHFLDIATWAILRAEWEERNIFPPAPSE